MAITYTIEQATWLNRPIREIFDFFSSVHNLERITPPWLNFQTLPPVPQTIFAGTIINYRLKLHGIPLFWRTEIACWEPPHRFIDRQIEGPYRQWIHTHTFVEKAGGTQMHDRVEYIVPGGLLAPLIHHLFVQKDVATIFAYRQEKMREIFLGS